MYSLPFELISEIFYICVKELCVPPEVVACVDRRLRAVALRSPTLWTDVYWEPSSKPVKIQDHNKALRYLDRSGHSPISLELRLAEGFLDDDWQLKERTALRLRSEFRRIRSLIIVQSQTLKVTGYDFEWFSEDVSDFLQSLDSEAPILESLAVRGRFLHRIPTLRLDSTKKRLQTLHIDSLLDSVLDFSGFTSLNTLTILLSNEFSWGECLVKIALLPALKRLKIDSQGHECWRAPSFTQKLILPKLLRLEIMSIDLGMLCNLECPIIEEFLLGPWNLTPKTDLSFVVSFLQMHHDTIRHLEIPDTMPDATYPVPTPIQFPQLVSYHGYHDSFSNGDILLRTIRPSALQHLTLLVDTITPEYLSEFIRRISPTIESITIQRCRFGPFEGQRNPESDIPETNWLSFPVLKKYITTCRAGDVLFGRFSIAPMLEELHLNGEPWQEDFPVCFLLSFP